MTTGGNEYSDLVNHPLKQVPPDVLDAARAMAAGMARWKNLDDKEAKPLADAILMAIAPYVAQWRDWQPRTEGVPWFLEMVREAAQREKTGDFWEGYLLGLRVAAPVFDVDALILQRVVQEARCGNESAQP